MKKKLTVWPLMKLEDGTTVELKKKTLLIDKRKPDLASDGDGRVYKKQGWRWIYTPE